MRRSSLIMLCIARRADPGEGSHDCVPDRLDRDKTKLRVRLDLIASPPKMYRRLLSVYAYTLVEIVAFESFAKQAACMFIDFLIPSVCVH